VFSYTVSQIWIWARAVGADSFAWFVWFSDEVLGSELGLLLPRGLRLSDRWEPGTAEGACHRRALLVY